MIMHLISKVHMWFVTLKPHAFICVNQFHLKSFNIYKLWVANKISRKLKLAIPHNLRCITKHSSQTNFKHLYKIWYVDTKTKMSVAACSLWQKSLSINKAPSNDEVGLLVFHIRRPLWTVLQHLWFTSSIYMYITIKKNYSMWVTAENEAELSGQFVFFRASRYIRAPVVFWIHI